MRLCMLKHCVVKGRHVIKPLHVCLIVLQYYARVATGRAGYVLYRALVVGVYSARFASGCVQLAILSYNAHAHLVLPW